MHNYKRKVMLKLNQLLINNKLRDVENPKKIIEEMATKGKEKDALKTVLSMQQQGYDMDMVQMEVLKHFNTGDTSMKYYVNHFVKNNFSTNPSKQLMCINSFLKDYKSDDLSIKKLAIHDSIALSDEELIKNYIKELKMMSKGCSDDIKIDLLVESVSMYNLNREVFLENNFDQFLIESIYSTNVKIAVAALKTLSELSKYENFISEKELISLLQKMISENKGECIRYIVATLVNSNVMNIKLITKLLMYSDICVYYSASIILLKNNLKYAQVIFDHGLSYLNLRQEQVYNILLYLYFISIKYKNHVQFDNKHFSIGENDILAIKLIKLKLLTSKMNQFALDEIKYLIYKKELLPDIYRICLEKDIYLPGILNFIDKSDVDEIIKITYLYKHKFKEENSLNFIHWHNDIKNLIFKTSPSLEMTPFYLEVASFLVKKVLGFVFNIDNKENQLIRYFLNMYFNNFITEDQCINYLNDIKNEYPLQSNMINILVKNINSAIPDNLFPFNYKIIDNANHDFTDLNQILNHNQQNINEEDKIPVEQKDGAKINLNTSSFKVEISETSDESITEESLNNLHKLSIKKPTDFDNVISSSESIDKQNKIDGYYYNGKEISGIFKIENGIVIFEVFDIKSDQLIYFQTDGGIDKTKICSIGEKEIHIIKLDDINKAVEIIIESKVIYFYLDFTDLVKENQQTSTAQFDNQFNEINNYAIVDTFPLDDVFYIDNHKFMFNLLGYQILGKSFGSQLIIKGHKEIINFMENKK